MKKFFVYLLLLVSIEAFSNFAPQKDTVHFTLSLENAKSHTLQVSMKCKTSWNKDSMVFSMPQWTPGYYQIMNYVDNLSNLKIFGDGKNLSFRKINNHSWIVATKDIQFITLQYEVTANRAFVASSIIDSTHAYLTPAATFLYIENNIQVPVSLTILQNKNWNRIATGLDSIAPNTYFAPDFDMLFDCPILAGNLEEFPPFTIKNIPHRFIAYQAGVFDNITLMKDLNRIVEASINIIGDIPYNHYTFLGIGSGNGGIEHLTSSANSFNGNAFKTPEGRKSMLSFLTHEYFHNFNVKRIRPLELGPFDYEKGSKTKQLWVSEGWTVYYEYLITRRAGIITDKDVYENLRHNILAYENHDGKNHQSLAEASEATWSDGPFGNDPEKTISYYSKGPIVALMLDFTIRHHTHNKKSLDDVMRKLYQKYYLQKKRGFTETELRKVCEATADKKLDELFDYVYTTKPLQYSKYLNLGGLEIDTTENRFLIRPLSQPSELQAKILNSWLGKK